MSHYLEQHQVINPFCCIIAGMRNTVINFDDLQGIFFLLFNGVHPQLHLFNAARAGNTGFNYSSHSPKVNMLGLHKLSIK